ncbi:WD40/YVTN/BNR-like repeat-containing protein [Pseudoalteromonas ulvae]|uniref:WD40/YVTN/BNR-like repeat-containing protein n=1 Tax=Pseudoalteromonas ulvae TaxID=107327 RepID=UPI00186B918A|nr:YCF48-related protein [Pseudoalteromonas ulvae]
MKLLLCTLFLLGSFSSLAEPMQPQAAIMAKKASQTLLTDIVNHGQGLVAVGKYGNILTSKDAINWQQAQVPVNVLLTSVFFIDDQLGWATGHDATILHSQDGGLTWQLQNYQPEVDKPLLDILFFDNKNGIAIGAYGLFYRTTDAGQTWQSEFQSTLLYDEDVEFLEELKQSDNDAYLNEINAILPHLNQVTFYQGKLLMVGELGLIATSEDLGKTWQRLEEIYPGSFFDIKVLNNGQWLVAGLRGNVFFSEDEGVNWLTIDTQSQSTVNQILVTETGALLSANNGVYLHFENKEIVKKQHADGKALLSAVKHNKTIVFASEVGIQVQESK